MVFAWNSSMQSARMLTKHNLTALKQAEFSSAHLVLEVGIIQILGIVKCHL